MRGKSRTGIRLATIETVAIATIAVFVAGGGLGELIFTDGIQRDLFLTPIVAGAVMAGLVVVFLNPLSLRSQRLVDRLFFRQRVDVQRSIEHVSEVMSGLLDLRRIDRNRRRTATELDGMRAVRVRGDDLLDEPSDVGLDEGCADEPSAQSLEVEEVGEEKLELP